MRGILGFIAAALLTVVLVGCSGGIDNDDQAGADACVAFQQELGRVVDSMTFGMQADSAAAAEVHLDSLSDTAREMSMLSGPEEFTKLAKKFAGSVSKFASAGKSVVTGGDDASLDRAAAEIMETGADITEWCLEQGVDLN